MLGQGFMIMAVGMAIVLFFLLILLCATKLSSFVIISMEKRAVEAEGTESASNSTPD